MKKLIRPALLVIISLLLVFISVAFSSSRSGQSHQLSEYAKASLLFQATPTPQPQEDRSEIGSTDGIMVMSFIIVAIIIIPIILKRKSWAQV